MPIALHSNSILADHDTGVGYQHARVPNVTLSMFMCVLFVPHCSRRRRRKLAASVAAKACTPVPGGLSDLKIGVLGCMAERLKVMGVCCLCVRYLSWVTPFYLVSTRLAYMATVKIMNGCHLNIGWHLSGLKSRAPLKWPKNLQDYGFCPPLARNFGLVFNQLQSVDFPLHGNVTIWRRTQ